MRRKTGLFQRIISVILSVALSSSMVLISIPMVTWAAEDLIDDTTEEAPYEIVSFAELPEEVRQQIVPVGTAVDELVLPDALTVTCRFDAEDSEDAGEEETEEEETEDTTDPEVPDVDAGDHTTPEIPDTETGDHTTPETPDAEAGGSTSPEDPETKDPAVTEPGTEESGEYIPDTDESDNSFQSEEVVEEIIEVQSVENLAAPDSISLQDCTSDGETKVEDELRAVTIEGIIWISAPEYDGDQEGSYVFTPVLPEGYIMSGSAWLPEITVTVGEAVDETEDEDELLALSEEEPLADDKTIIVSSPETWGTRVYADGTTIVINPGVTLTLTGIVTTSGHVTIEGGGTITRNNGTAHLSAIGDLELQSIVLDGGSIPASEPMLTVIGGSATLDAGCRITNCDVTYGNLNEGGAIRVTDGQLYVYGAKIYNCEASNKGGAIFLRNSQAVINNGAAISVCNANYGGAICCVSSTLTMSNATIEQCTASYNGGAICTENNSTVNIYGGTYQGNTTTESSGFGNGVLGGGFIANTGILNIYGGSFTGNSTATGNGGCIYHDAVAGTNTYIAGGTFSGNGNYAIYDAASRSDGQAGNTTLTLSGNARLTGGDGIYLGKSNSIERMFYVTSPLATPLTVHLTAREGYVVAEGSSYTLQDSDLKNIHVVDNGGTQGWYVVLQGNQAILTQTPPEYTEKFFVYYYSNGAQGQVVDDNNGGQGYDPGTTGILVKSADTLTWENHTFKEWNTDPTGSGTRYLPGATLPALTGDVTLYAIFTEDKDPGNGDSGNTGGGNTDPSNPGGNTGGNSGSGNQGGSGDSGNYGDYGSYGDGSGFTGGSANMPSWISLIARATGSSTPKENGYNGPSPITGLYDNMQFFAAIALIAALSAIMLMFIGRHGMTEEEKNALVARLVRWARRGGTLRKMFSISGIFLLLACYHTVGKQTVVEAGAC